MHRKFQKFYQTCGAHDVHVPHVSLLFLYPYFSDESYAPECNVLEFYRTMHAKAAFTTAQWFRGFSQLKT